MVAFEIPNDLSQSTDPSLLRGLDEEQQSRLTKLLDEYLVGLEQGERLDEDEIVRSNPDLESVFRAYLEKLRALYGIAAGMNPSMDASATPLPADKRLGDFVLQREIGRGGMGVVYEASQVSLDRRVAIKLLPLASMLDSNQIARFKNEAHAAGLLQHPNIVPIHNVGSHQGVHYYAMAYIDGVSLDAWVATHKEHSSAVNWREVVRWGVDVADALHEAHENGVVHRDIKPSNLMLDGHGKIWVTDFGLARCQTELSLTRSGDVIGTMRYMSPEQSRGQTALIDGRADVYSLAVTLYECLTLRRAHEGEDAATILKQIDDGEVQPLRATRPDLPLDLETVIRKAMSKSREDRYDTAMTFAEDLQRVLRDEPTLARPPSIIDRCSRLASKHRKLAFVATMVILIAFVGSAIANAKLAAAKSESDLNAERATKVETLTRGALDELGAEIAERLDDVPAAEPVRRQLLLTMLEYYERFASEVKDDPELREDLAMTLAKVGDLQSELGDSEQAIAALRRSDVIYKELAASSSTSDSIRLAWSNCQNNLAQALMRDGQMEEAARLFVRAMDAQKDLANSSGLVLTRTESKIALATSLNNMGLLLMQSGINNQAEDAFRDAIDRLKPLALAISDDDTKISANRLRVHKKLAAIRSNLAGLLTAEHPERAIEQAQLALKIQLSILEADPSNVDVASQTIVAVNTLGAAQSEAGQPAEAIATLHQAISIGEPMVERWPHRPNHRRDVTLSYNQLGLLHSKQGTLEDAKIAFEQALRLGRPLVEQFSNDAETLSMLGGVLNNYGFLQQQRQDSDSANTAYAEAIQLQTAAVNLAPEVQRYNEYLQKHRANQQSIQPVQSVGSRKTSGKLKAEKPVSRDDQASIDSQGNTP
ncbi:protein kinase [Rhodopirellula sp. JC740]|uniref:Protein kinase n=1 Tax=Rhodopirellula halodulae TaxID=2894198 RepID=A0ABS8NH32_9BACT|nr:protein kinase [Rhodopirellula sp. JC740]MCC9642855.1 protein kinase [Rhodopirellula sp. JC740]